MARLKYVWLFCHSCYVWYKVPIQGDFIRYSQFSAPGTDYSVQVRATHYSCGNYGDARIKTVGNKVISLGRDKK